MKMQVLFPHHFNTFGWVLFVPGLLLGAWTLFADGTLEWLDVQVPALYADPLFQSHSRDWFHILPNNLTNELAGVLILIGGLFVAFSRQKKEDEYLAKLRQDSLLWATYVNYAFLLLSILFVYESGFFIILVFNMFTLLFFFIIRFNLLLWLEKKRLSHAE